MLFPPAGLVLSPAYGHGRRRLCTIERAIRVLKRLKASIHLDSGAWSGGVAHHESLSENVVRYLKLYISILALITARRCRHIYSQGTAMIEAVFVPSLMMLPD